MIKFGPSYGGPIIKFTHLNLNKGDTSTQFLAYQTKEKIIGII